MMRRVLLLIAVATSAPLVAPATPAAAETTVKVDGNVLRITIKVDVFAAENVTTAPDGRPLDVYWEEILNNTWGEAFTRLPYKNCFKLELKLDLELRDINDNARKGRHQIFVGTETRGWRGVGWDNVPESKRNPDTGDGIDSYDNDRMGDIPANAPPIVVAHEFGHVMGLGDDRKDGVAKNTRDGTVMVGGAKGVDPYAPYQPSMIDKDLIDRLGKVVERYLKDQNKKLPKCETWKGPIKGSLTAPGCSPTNPSVDGEMEVGVVRNQVVGTGNWVEQAYSCGGVTAGPFEFSFPVTGTKTDDQFDLDVGPDGLSMNIVGSKASGTVEVFGNAGFGSSLTFTLERENDEPVG